MTNKEKYKQAFSVLHTSGKKTWEVEKMIQIQKKHKANIAVAAAVTCAILIGVSGTAYAADLGGIREKLALWIHGQETEVDISYEKGSYTYTYEQDGETHVKGGGGVNIDENGAETPISAEELFAYLNEYAEVETDEDGTIWVYYYEQQINISDLFDENGFCRIALSHEGETVYLEVELEQDGGYCYSQRNSNIPEEEKALYTVIDP